MRSSLQIKKGKTKEKNTDMSKQFILPAALIMMGSIAMKAQQQTVASPDGKLVATVNNQPDGITYSVTYGAHDMLLPSALGVVANNDDFGKALTLKDSKTRTIDQTYQLRQAKATDIHYQANELTMSFASAKGFPMDVVFRVSNNDVAFRYQFAPKDGVACMTVTGEHTAFRLPAQTTTFICPQSGPMGGWMRTKPSYEEEYKPDAPLVAASAYGQGYTFPCLFRLGDDGWVMVSETGTHGQYVGCHLSDYDSTKGYTIAFPMEGESNGFGGTMAGMPLPSSTPWRTITVGTSLKPIVETTVAYDVVEPLYAPNYDYLPGRYTWSWLVWQDNSINYDDQVAFIDVAAAMGDEYCLVDACWDTNIGRERMERLSQYAQGKGVALMLWYNSNGAWNDAPQTPVHRMDKSAARRAEMAWMQRIGVKGIKVDFFGGDKQHTMQLYEDILTDANEFGLQVIFHGCTLPRGWERMFPNFVGSEAVLASENVYFSDYHARQEGFQLTMHPFCRNAVASMDWGGTIMNRYLSKDNQSRHRRFTSDTFEMAASIVNQCVIQCIAMQPNNLTDLPQFEKDFLKTVPTQWQETRFIDGYPGRYVVLARKSTQGWIVAALNGTDKPISLELPMPMGARQSVTVYDDAALKKGALWPESRMRTDKTDKNGNLRLTLQPCGGAIVK